MYNVLLAIKVFTENVLYTKFSAIWASVVKDVVPVGSPDLMEELV